jgi:hypothetical protein
MLLTHYIIVRRDLGLGDMLAQSGHAAGESFYKFAEASLAQLVERLFRNQQAAGSIPAASSSICPGSSEKERIASPECGKVVGSSPAPGSNLSAGRPSEDTPILNALKLECSERADVGSNPSLRAILPDVAQTVIRILGARNEQRLMRLRSMLEAYNIDHVAITETDGYLRGNLTAIGIVPCVRNALLDKLLHDFHQVPNLTIDFGGFARG